MVNLDRFRITNFWGSRNITLDFNSKFVILTGHNGCGKSTILELLHDSFSLIHDKKIEIIHDSWASELNFSDDTIVRSYFVGGDFDLSNDLKRKIATTAKNSVKMDVFKSFESINATIQKYLKKKYKDPIVKKDFSSSPKEKSFLTMQYHPTKEDIILPKTIFFKDNRVLYNSVSDEVKEVKDLEIFNEVDSINKTLYLLMNAFIIQESKNKKSLFSKKSEIKNEVIKELQLALMSNGDLKTFDGQLLSKIDGLVEKVMLREKTKKTWGGELFSAINEFLKKTNRCTDRDENGFIAFKLNDDKIIKWYNFSRGEKTLLVLLLSVFLNKNEDVIFILDEPDLSLHIEWQELLLPILSSLAPERQFILSTHSPALIGNIDEQYLNIAAITE
ncbi:hypothetical protein A6V27_00010 [Hafnia alvei]|uniref:AAA family ATPase n=1 Tax=Hafnia alvei TaxID=569 RepID=UPI0007BCBCB1|nr:AAA family ATPase [Hafnia alvei]ANC38875.1 hypothetical protein A6V27_00010 [Hafnia alvei]